MIERWKSFCRFIGFWFCYWGTGGVWEGTLHFRCEECGAPFKSHLDMLAAMRAPQRKLSPEEKEEILMRRATR